MARVTVVKCDGCGKYLERPSQRFRLYKVILVSDKFTDAAGEIDCNEIALDFCEMCAHRLLQTLERIARRLESEQTR